MAVSGELRMCSVVEGCRAFSAPDVDRDGRDEIAVATGHEDVLEFVLFAVLDCSGADGCARPVLRAVTTPDDVGWFAGDPLTIGWGSSDGMIAGARCASRPVDPATGATEPVLVVDTVRSGGRQTTVALTFDGAVACVVDRPPLGTPTAGGFELCVSPAAVERPPSLTAP